MKGDAGITYDDIARINSRLIAQFSPEVIKLAMPDLKIIYGAVDTITAGKTSLRLIIMGRPRV